MSEPGTDKNNGSNDAERVRKGQFAKGNPGGGRKAGSRNRLPKGTLTSVRQAITDLVSGQPSLIRSALEQGLAAPPPKSFPYLQLCAHYIDGPPGDVPRVPGPPFILALLNVVRDPLAESEKAERVLDVAALPLPPTKAA